MRLYSDRLKQIRRRNVVDVSDKRHRHPSPDGLIRRIHVPDLASGACSQQKRPRDR